MCGPLSKIHRRQRRPIPWFALFRLGCRALYLTTKWDSGFFVFRPSSHPICVNVQRIRGVYGVVDSFPFRELCFGVVGSCTLNGYEGLHFFATPSVVFVQFRVCRRVQCRRLLLQCSRVCAVSSGAPCVVNHRYARCGCCQTLNFSLGRFFLFPRLPQDVYEAIYAVRGGCIVPRRIDHAGYVANDGVN